MPTPAQLPLHLLAVVAIVARRLVPDVLAILASIAGANVAARRASGVYDLTPAPTAGSILDQAIVTIGADRSGDDAAVALAGEALLAVWIFRKAMADQLAGDPARRLQDLTEAVVEVERAARNAPAGVAPEDITRGEWTGPRFVSGREVAEITADLRRDLAAASKAPGALRGVSCRVRKTGHFAIEIEVVAVPDHALLLNPARVAAEMVSPHGYTGLSWQSARGLAIIAAVTKLANAYSTRRGSDVELHVEVTFAESIQQAQRAEIQAAVRLASAAA